MNTHTATTSPQIYARLAGFLYLLVVPLGIFGVFYVFPSLIVPGDAAATAQNLLTGEALFRLGIVSDMLATITMLLVVLVLRQLLKAVNQPVALLMVMLVIVGAAIALLNKVNQFAALLLLSSADYLAVFTPAQLQALAYLFLRLGSQGSTIAFVFWGLWLFPLGYLVFRSGFLPRILGLLLMVACVGYLIDCFASFLGYRVSIGMYAAGGEVLFILWLLIRGVNVAAWHNRVLAAQEGVR
jgi:Domain of unknown function (DUF4386)